MPSRIPIYRPPGPTARPAPRRGERFEAGRVFLDSQRWRKLRRLKLSIDPLCQDCKGDGRLTEAKQVHHIESRFERPDLAYDIENLMSLCESCHGRRTARGE
jgi:5-methylcytosine-specific restriction protein A